MKVLHIDPDQYYHQKFREIASPDAKWLFSKKPSELSKLLNSHKPDVILMELFFPDIHGFTLLKRIKTHPERSQVPIIIFSTLDHVEDIQEAMRFGVTGYFVKGQNTIDDVHKLVLSLS